MATHVEQRGPVDGLQADRHVVGGTAVVLLMQDGTQVRELVLGLPQTHAVAAQSPALHPGRREARPSQTESQGVTSESDGESVDLVWSGGVLKPVPSRVSYSFRPISIYRKKLTLQRVVYFYISDTNDPFRMTCMGVDAYQIFQTSRFGRLKCRPCHDCLRAPVTPLA